MAAVSAASGAARRTSKDGLILVHQVRTVDLARVTAFLIEGDVQYVTDPVTRRRVRENLSHHLGLDLSPDADGAVSG
ncbi:MAG TPA: hypothetical protein VNF73_16405 [Candidatus Saccharimonadales bacterium]|nr:hypothetical protein [Candidatus Saccharimonadales bacterium]